MAKRLYASEGAAVVEPVLVDSLGVEIPGAQLNRKLPASSSGLTNPMTTQGDLIVGAALGAPARLAPPAADGSLLLYSAAAASSAWTSGGTYRSARHALFGGI